MPPFESDAALPPLLRGLNPEQLAAVTQPAEPALILAGAGSGKTRVLTTRIAWLIQTGQVSPGGILAVTFTNKAAKEMLHRLGTLLPINLRGLWVGTFHGLSNRFLRAHWKLAGLPQAFQILDATDSVSAVKRVVKALGIPEERCPPKPAAWAIANAKEAGLRPGQLPVHDELSRWHAEIYAAYEDQCAREGVVDFAELLLRTVELLEREPALRQHYQQRFRHVLVDEFQDTNTLQYRWLQCFAPPPGRGETPGQGVFAVGDDDQSIYAFRGAQVANMADFEQLYRVRQVVKLERNYRSHGNILDAANHLIAHNSRRLGKNLRTEAGAGEPVRVQESATDFAEAQWLVEEARQLHREGSPRHEIAVLYRSNAQSRVVESALFNAGLPYKVYGGLRFFERAEVKHALAYLRLIENPDDDTSFLRVVNFPARGIGARTLEQLVDAARASGRSLHQAIDAVPGKGGASLAAFRKLVEGLREVTAGLTLREIIEHVVEASGLADHYRAEKEGEERLENLGELVNAAEAFVTQEGFGKDAIALPVDELGPAAAGSAPGTAIPPGTLAAPRSPDEPAAVAPAAPGPLTPDAETGEIISPLAAFLSHASLEAGDNQAQAGEDAIQLMTVHAAKGLEFDQVFITGLEEGLFPHENAMSDSDGLEEERRLMYVALTRARKRLYLSFSQSRMLHGQVRYHVKSRFLDELPEGALKWLSPRQAGFGHGSPYGSGGAGHWRGDSGRSGGDGWRREREPGSPWAEAPATPPAWLGTAQAQAAAASTGAPALRPGQGVFHTKFGEGVLLTLEGSGADARAQVRFGRHGIKWLALSVAKLTPVD